MTDKTATGKTNMDTDAWTGGCGQLPLTESLSVMGKLGGAYMLRDINIRMARHSQ